MPFSGKMAAIIAAKKLKANTNAQNCSSLWEKPAVLFFKIYPSHSPQMTVLFRKKTLLTLSCDTWISAFPWRVPRLITLPPVAWMSIFLLWNRILYTLKELNLLLMMIFKYVLVSNGLWTQFQLDLSATLLGNEFRYCMSSINPADFILFQEKLHLYNFYLLRIC